jgi:peroxiredoxin
MAGEIKITKKFIVFFFAGIVLAVFLGIVAGQVFNQWRMGRAQAKYLKENPPITLKEGDIVPNFSFVTLDGQEQKLYDKLQYDKGIVLLMTTSCGFCAEEIEKWKEERQDLPAGVQLLAISPDSLNRLTTYTQEKGIDFTMLCDKDGKFFEQYEVKSFPVLLLVDENKKVVKVFSGFDPKLEIRDYVKTLAMK